MKNRAFEHGAYQFSHVDVTDHLQHLAEEASVVNCIICS